MLDLDSSKWKVMRAQLEIFQAIYKEGKQYEYQKLICS